MNTTTQTPPDAVFDIPPDLAFNEAPDCLAALRAQLTACPAEETVLIGLDSPHGLPSQLALELLFSANASAQAGAPIRFTDPAAAYLAKAAPVAGATTQTPETER